jgi:hypothetical protein
LSERLDRVDQRIVVLEAIAALLPSHRVLQPLTPADGRRAAILAFPELLSIAEGKRVF